MNPEKRPSSASSTCSLFAVRCLLPGEGELMNPEKMTFLLLLQPASLFAACCLLPGEGELMNPEKMTFLLLLQPARCLLLAACFPEVERDHE
jgi:hypothetical protein